MRHSIIHNRAARQPQSSKNFQSVTANISGEVREETLDGREYWVVPVRMLREGVLNGSGGPVLYKRDDMERYAASWDMKPVVVNHPTTRNGSAASKKILEKYGVGFLLDNEVNGSYQDANAWIDKAKADKVDIRIRQAIENGIRMEVSTGLFADQLRKKGRWNGDRYKGVAKNYRPDHLALLPDMVGACSLAHGCGLITANQAIPLKRMKKIQDVVNRLWKGKPLGNCGCQHKKGDSSMKKTSKSRAVKVSANAKRLIDRIIGDGSGNWSKDDLSMLRKMDEDALKKIDAGRRQLRKLKATAKSADKLANAAAARRREKKRRRQEAERKARLQNSKSRKRRPCDDDDDDEQEPIRNQLASIKTVDEALRLMPKPIRSMLSNGLGVYRQQRKQLVKIVLANKANKFTKEQLQKMDDDVLNKLALMANEGSDDDSDEPSPFNFFGRQGAASLQNTSGLEIDEAPLYMPSTAVANKKKGAEDDEE